MLFIRPTRKKQAQSDHQSQHLHKHLAVYRYPTSRGCPVSNEAPRINEAWLRERARTLKRSNRASVRSAPRSKHYKQVDPRLRGDDK